MPLQETLFFMEIRQLIARPVARVLRLACPNGHQKEN